MDFSLGNSGNTGTHAYGLCCGHNMDQLIFNPRRACAARVTVLALHISWGAIFSVGGGGGGGGGVKG